MRVWVTVNTIGDEAEISASLATRKTRVYRMFPSDDLRDLVAAKTLAGDSRHEIQDVLIGSVPGLLVFGESEASPVPWASAINSLTGVELEFTSTTASAALFLRVDSVNYALAFGQGRHCLRRNKVDRQFGLDIAVRMLDPDEIRKITRWALSAKARVDQNVVPGGQGLWAFGLREHAELVRNLTGRVNNPTSTDLTYVRHRGGYRSFRLSLECADSVYIPLGLEGESLISDLRELNRVIDEVPVDPRLEPLQWVRRLAPGDDRQETLDAEVADLLAAPDPNQGEVGIAYPARYYDGPTVHRYQGAIGSLGIDTDELTIDRLRQCLLGHSRDEYVRVLRASSIEGLDENGTTLGGDVSALHWLAGEIVRPAQRFVLIDGEWYELGDEYLRHVEHKVAQAFANTPEWTLPPWDDAPRNEEGKVVEGAYNAHVADQDPRFLCLDRKLVKTRIHPRGFEACDLLGPDNELVHVKKASSSTGSSVLSHLFAQGLVAIESLTDPQTWATFVALVREQDPDRANSLGARPAGLVYAIHRPDKPLRPGTLFTFARSALASACVSSHSTGVPVQISVIP